MADFVEWLKDQHAHGRGGVFALLVLAMLAFCAWNAGPGRAFLGRNASELNLVDPGGNVHRVGDLQGKVVVLDFWATWCPPCQASLPEVAALQARQGGQYAVLPVSLDQAGFQDVRPFLHAHPQWDLFTVVPADTATLAAQVGVIRAIPTTLVLDRDGKVVRAWSGYSPGRLERELQGVLDAAEGAPGAPARNSAGALAHALFPFVQGPAFLVFYPLAILLALGAGLLSFRTLGRPGSRALPRMPDLYGVAYLRNRAKGVLEVVLTRLSVLGLLDSQLRAHARPGGQGGPDLDPMEQAVLERGGWGPFPELERFLEAGQAARFASYGRVLAAEGLIPDAGQLAWCGWIRWACTLLALGFGGARLLGVYALEPKVFGFLFVEMAILVPWLYLRLAPPMATARGRALLDRVAREVSSPLLLARDFGTSGDGTVPLSLAVAALGKGALAGTPHTF